MIAATCLKAPAQSIEPFNPYGIFSPEVETFSMVKYGGLTPSLFTGAMSFSVPVYTYQDPDFTIPITLEYNFDGYRPAQHSGSVGYGWHLNCGGAITREVRGIPDEGEHQGLTNNYGWLEATPEIRRYYTCDSQTDGHAFGIRSMSYPGLENITQQDYAGYIRSYDIFSDTPAFAFAQGSTMVDCVRYDMAPDIYRFNFLGCSGEFTFDIDGNPVIYNTSVPKGEVNVSVTDGNGFMITLGNGTKYTFEEADISYSINLYADVLRYPYRSVTGFRLTGIEAPNGREVTFEYTSGRYASVNPAYLTSRWGHLSAVSFLQSDCFEDDFNDYYADVKWSYAYDDTNLLSKIKVCGTTIVDLSYESAGRNEYAADNYQDSRTAILPYVSGTTSRLKDIAVKNMNGQTVESCVLEHEQPSTGTPKLLLKSVSTLKGGKFSFSYNVGRVLPPNDTQDYDHWGYWNGNKGISDLRDYLRNKVYFTGGGCYSSGLYDQLTDDSVKAPDPAYSISCALSRITYPTGGTTDIAYEANTVSRRTMLGAQGQPYFEDCIPYDVGGVRVRSITDTSAGGVSSTKTFHYSGTMDDMTSGMLTQMPRYAEVVSYEHRAEGGSNSSHLGIVATITAIGFNNSCHFTLSRGSHITYPVVIEEYPDSSYTVTTFTSHEQYPDIITYGSLGLKRPFSHYETISWDDGATSVLNIVSMDRQDMRGKPLSIVTYNNDGTEMTRKTYSYSPEISTVGPMFINNLFEYKQYSHSAGRLHLVNETELDHGMSVEKQTAYNSLGQISSQKVITGGDIRSTYYRYRHETDSNATLPALISAAVKTTTLDALEYITQSEAYSYAGNNPQPIAVTEYVIDTPVRATDDVFAEPTGTTGRTTQFSYSGSLRLTRIDYPGGGYISYTWDPDNILVTSKTQNGTGNTSLYEWKSLVGLTKSTSPSGMYESYTYDSKNRLRAIKDTGGNTVTEYDYKLNNE